MIEKVPVIFKNGGEKGELIGISSRTNINGITEPAGIVLKYDNSMAVVSFDEIERNLGGI